MQILKGHTSADTAYVVDDYPYGFRLRCKMRYWLEVTKHGTRLVSQSSNPKLPGLVWNKPKASTYFRFGGCMFLNDEGHVTWAGLSEYSDGAEAAKFRDTYGEGVPEAARELMLRWVNAKVAYDANRTKGDALGVGLPEARAAFVRKLEGC